MSSSNPLLDSLVSNVPLSEEAMQMLLNSPELPPLTRRLPQQQSGLIGSSTPGLARLERKILELEAKYENNNKNKGGKVSSSDDVRKDTSRRHKPSPPKGRKKCTNSSPQLNNNLRRETHTYSLRSTKRSTRSGKPFGLST